MSYMSVKELNQDEMYQLKDTLYSDFYYYRENLPELTDEQRNHIESAEYPDDISDSIIHEVYGDISFVKDDFWCNV